jgi:hypothetical protein
MKRLETNIQTSQRDKRQPVAFGFPHGVRATNDAQHKSELFLVELGPPMSY